MNGVVTAIVYVAVDTLTETAPVLTTTLGRPALKVGSVGHSLPEVEIKLIDGDGEDDIRCFNREANGTIHRGTDYDDTNPAIRLGSMICDGADAVVVFFPVTFLYGVSKYLFSALALAVALSLFASFAVAMTVVPLFCARFIKAPAHHGTPSSEQPVTVDRPRRRWSIGDRFNIWFNDRFEAFLKLYDRMVGVTLRRPIVTLRSARAAPPRVRGRPRRRRRSRAR